MADKIKLRRDTLANWEAVNPILDEGEVGIITDSNAIVIGDGVTGFKDLQEIPNQELPNEYFNIYKNSKLLFESTTDFYGLPHYLITDISTMKQYIVVRKGTLHGDAPSQIVKIDLITNEETILIDGTTSSPQIDYRDGFLVYHNNIPYIFTSERHTDGHITRLLVINALTGDIIKEDTTLPVQGESYITVNNDVYFLFPEVGGENYNHYIIKYSFDTNNFTILNTFSTPTKETECTLGKINGKFFTITRAYDLPNANFNLHLFNNDWSIKTSIPLDLGFPVGTTTPYVFRKGSKLLFTFISRNLNSIAATPGNLFTYEIKEENDNFSFELKNIFPAVLPEDVYSNSLSDQIEVAGYQGPTILPFSKTGLILVEDDRTTTTYKTRLYQLDYDNDISVDYSNF